MGSTLAQLFVFIVVIVAAVAFYLLPSFVASSRGHERSGTILALNVLLGWTLAAWVVLLVWAFSSKRTRPA